MAIDPQICRRKRFTSTVLNYQQINCIYEWIARKDICESFRQFHVEDHLSNFNKAFYAENNILERKFFFDLFVLMDRIVIIGESPLFICK